MPTKVRSQLGDHFVMTKGYGGPCIWIFTQAKWDAFMEELESRPMLDDQTNLLKRYFIGSEGVLDNQGRVAIPGSLRAHAEIKDPQPVTLVATGSRLEIWSSAAWIAYNASVTKDMVREAARGTGV